MQKNHSKKCIHNNNRTLTTYGGFADPELDDAASHELDDVGARELDDVGGRERDWEDERIAANSSTRWLCVVSECVRGDTKARGIDDVEPCERSEEVRVILALTERVIGAVRGAISVLAVCWSVGLVLGT
jgi:hypothetical protein